MPRKKKRHVVPARTARMMGRGEISPMKHFVTSTAVCACALLLLPATGAAGLPPCKVGDKNWLVSRDMTGTSDGRDRILLERTDMGLSYRGARAK
jgi:hypothetical protein